MKKINAFLCFVFLLFVCFISVSSAEMVVITGYDVRFRTKPSTTNGDIIVNLQKNTELTLIDKNVGSGNGCTNTWYKVIYENKTGYVCSDYAEIKMVEEINPEDYEEYSEYLVELGFPDSYISKLVDLHAKHPKWQFKLLEVDYDFSSFVSLEYDGYYKGWSLIEDTRGNFDGYKSFDSWSYNYLLDEFNTNFTGGEKDRWYAANKETISYYLDPRNFLDEKRVFMFEILSYNANYHTKEGVEAMLKGTFMESGYADEEAGKTFVDAFIDAGIKYNISPYVLASRVIQEVGTKGSVIVSGTYSGYEGYYNFYNIKAAGNSIQETITNGLIYAKKQGWDTKYKAILGGAAFLGDDYISSGQDTLYLQKWDVFGPDYVEHQYMQNIQAPYSESIKTYKGYMNINLIDSDFVFIIPVFKDMPDETKLPNSGNPNNYLSSLSVNGEYLFKEAGDKTEYSLNLSLATTSIDIAASKVSSKAMVSGTGSISLTGDKTAVLVNVQAENGDIRTYTINITRTSDIALSIGEILRLLEINNDGTYIFGLELGTDISTIKKNIIDKESKLEISALDKNGKVKTDGIIATGDKIKIKSDNEEKEYTIVLYGDINGDGKVDKVDAAAILRYYYNYTSYDGVYKLAADVNRDKIVDKVDVAAVLRHLYGYDKIEQ